MERDWDKIHTMYIYGLSFSDIAEQLNIKKKSRSGIRDGLKRKGLLNRPKNYRIVNYLERVRLVNEVNKCSEKLGRFAKWLRDRPFRGM